jgi:hypothetical protein
MGFRFFYCFSYHAYKKETFAGATDFWGSELALRDQILHKSLEDLCSLSLIDIMHLGILY